MERKPPFDPNIHLKSIEPTQIHNIKINEFRKKLSENVLYHKHIHFCSDEQLMRFLIAKNFDLKKSSSLILDALKWRDLHSIENIETVVDWEQKFSKEGETGKIYNPGFDCWGRPIVVFDNAVQNTKCVGN